MRYSFSIGIYLGGALAVLCFIVSINEKQDEFFDVRKSIDSLRVTIITLENLSISDVVNTKQLREYTRTTLIGSLSDKSHAPLHSIPYQESSTQRFYEKEEGVKIYCLAREAVGKRNFNRDSALLFALTQQEILQGDFPVCEYCKGENGGSYYRIRDSLIRAAPKKFPWLSEKAVEEMRKRADITPIEDNVQ